MEARVEKTCKWPKVQSCAGVEFLKGEWTAVPPGREAEAKANPFLETRKGPPVRKPKPEKVEEPAAEAEEPAPEASTDEPTRTG